MKESEKSALIPLSCATVQSVVLLKQEGWCSYRRRKQSLFRPAKGLIVKYHSRDPQKITDITGGCFLSLT